MRKEEKAGRIEGFHLVDSDRRDLEGDIMMTEEPHITIEQLVKRWPGMTYDMIGDNIGQLFGNSPAPFPKPFMRQGPERLNPNTGNTVWCVAPLDSAPYWDREYGWDLPGVCFRLDAIEQYEESHPEFFYQIVDANELPAPPGPGLAPDNEYITADEARRHLKMSPTAFAGYLIRHRVVLPLVGLTPEDRAYFYGKDTPIEYAAEELHQISIHRLDWENHLKALAGPDETKAPGAREDDAKLRGGLADVVADYEAKLKQAEGKLAWEQKARIKAEEAAKVKSTDKATKDRLSGQLEEWKKAFVWTIKAAIDVVRDGQKARSKTDLWLFVEAAGGPKREVVEGANGSKRIKYNAQFEAWRAALPDGYYDKGERTGKPQIDDEPLEG